MATLSPTAGTSDGSINLQEQPVAKTMSFMPSRRSTIIMSSDSKNGSNRDLTDEARLEVK